MEAVRRIALDCFLGCGQCLFSIRILEDQRFILLLPLIRQHLGILVPRAVLVKLPVPFPVIFHFGVLKQGHLYGRFVRQARYAQAHLPDRRDAVPDFREHLPGRIENDGRHIRGLLQRGLLLRHRKVLVLDKHRHARCPEIVPANAVRNNAGHVEHSPVDVLRIQKVLRKSPFGTIALGLGNLRLHRRIVAAIGILVQLHGELLADKPRQRAHTDGSQLTDGFDAIGREALLRLFPYP